MPHEQSQDLTPVAPSAIRTDFLPTLSHDLRDHTVDADRCQKTAMIPKAESTIIAMRRRLDESRISLIDGPVIERRHCGPPVDGRLER